MNKDFEFDFETAIASAYHDDEIYQDISCIAKGLDLHTVDTEKAIRSLIKINSNVLAKVLRKYNLELLSNL